MENLHTRKSEEVPALYAVEANFPIIYLCLLLYVSYDSLKILLSSRIEKGTQFWKFDNHMSSIDPRHLFAVIWVAELRWLPCSFFYVATENYDTYQILTLAIKLCIYFDFFTNGWESMFYTFLDVLATEKNFAAAFYSRIWVAGWKENLPNILPKFGACHLQLITLIFF